MILLLMALMMETTLPIQVEHLSYVERLEQRQLEVVEVVVIHATETPDLRTAKEFAEQIHYQGSQTGNSGHYYVDLDGTVYEYVPTDRVAHHVANYNLNTIGIELVNRGRFPYWFDTNSQQWDAIYPQAQLDALYQLVEMLKLKHANVSQIARHSDLDPRLVPASNDENQQVRRKLDPGTTFPWETFVRSSQLKPVKPVAISH